MIRTGLEEEFKEMLEPMGYTVKSMKDLKEPIEIESTPIRLRFG